MWWAGQTQGLIHDVVSMRELVGCVIAEAEEIIAGRLAGMLA